MKSRFQIRPCLLLFLLCGLPFCRTFALDEFTVDVSGLSPAQAAAVRLLVTSETHHRAIDPINYTVGRMSMEEAYGVQDRLVAVNTIPVAGYKLAFASEAAQKQWKIDGPVCGRLSKDRKVDPGGSIESASFRKLLLEAEVAFTVGRDIETPLTTVAELRDRTASLHLSLDILDLPFSSENAPPSVEDIVCANAAASHYMLGPALSPAEAGDLTGLDLSLTHDGKEVYSGSASNVMGDPWNAYLWLANHLIKRGTPLRQGDVVLSGAVSAAYGGGPDGITGKYVAEGGVLGQIDISVK